MHTYFKLSRADGPEDVHGPLYIVPDKPVEERSNSEVKLSLGCSSYEELSRQIDLMELDLERLRMQATVHFPQPAS